LLNIQLGKGETMTKNRSLKILLADNEEIVHQIIADYLQDSGHKVDRTHSRAAVLKAVKEHEYDLALLDIHLLDTSKLSLLAEMCETRSEMSVIIITGRGDMDVAIQAIRHGALDFLTKPIRLLELDAVLEKSIRHRALVVRCMQMEKALNQRYVGGNGNGSSTGH
jgi:DNA-binding NtrC family response regulator